MREQQLSLSEHDFWTTGARPSSADEMEKVVRHALNSAISCAATGNLRHARELCAAVVLENQPLIAARRDLLHRTFEALIITRGFRLLSRLVMAISGGDVQVTVLPDGGPAVVSPSRSEGNGRITYALDASSWDRLSSDGERVRRWSAELVASTLAPIDTQHQEVASTAPAPFSLEPV